MSEMNLWPTVEIWLGWEFHSLKKGVGLLEKSHSGVELLNGVVALTLLRKVLQELECGCIDGRYGGEKRAGNIIPHKCYYKS